MRPDDRLIHPTQTEQERSRNIIRNARVHDRFFQFLRNFHQLTAFEQAEMILYAALDPSIASKAKKGEFVKCLDHFDLLQSARN